MVASKMGMPLAAIQFLPWHQARRGLVPAGASVAGNAQRWIEYPELVARDFGGRLLAFPAGFGSTDLDLATDAVLLGVRGNLEVTVDGRPHGLGPLDLLRLPAGKVARVLNVGAEFGSLAVVRSTVQAGEAGAASEVLHMAWQDYRRDFAWNLPLAEQWGYHRGSGPYIAAEGIKGHTVRMPVAQTTPWHHVPRDILFLCLDGGVDFHAGGRRWDLEPLDMLLVPAGTPYRYQNCGTQEVFFLSIGGGMVPSVRSTYYASDPGWPPRPETPRIDTAHDAYGNARVVG